MLALFSLYSGLWWAVTPSSPLWKSKVFTLMKSRYLYTQNTHNTSLTHKDTFGIAAFCEPIQLKTG